MDVLDTVVSTTVLVALGLVLAWMGNRRFEGTERRLAVMEQVITAQGSELRGEIAALGSELRGEIASQGSELRTEIRALRADLTQIALAVGAQQPTRDTA